MTPLEKELHSALVGLMQEIMNMVEDGTLELLDVWRNEGWIKAVEADRAGRDSRELNA